MRRSPPRLSGGRPGRRYRSGDRRVGKGRVGDTIDISALMNGNAAPVDAPHL